MGRNLVRASRSPGGRTHDPHFQSVHGKIVGHEELLSSARPRQYTRFRHALARFSFSSSRRSYARCCGSRFAADGCATLDCALKTRTPHETWRRCSVSDEVISPSIASCAQWDLCHARRSGLRPAQLRANPPAPRIHRCPQVGERLWPPPFLGALPNEAKRIPTCVKRFVQVGQAQRRRCLL